MNEENQSILRRKILRAGLSATDEMLLLRALRLGTGWGESALISKLATKGKEVARELAEA